MLFLYMQLGMISNSVLYSHWSLNIVSIAGVIWAHFFFPSEEAVRKTALTELCNGKRDNPLSLSHEAVIKPKFLSRVISSCLCFHFRPCKRRAENISGCLIGSVRHKEAVTI